MIKVWFELNELEKELEEVLDMDDPITLTKEERELLWLEYIHEWQLSIDENAVEE